MSLVKRLPISEVRVTSNEEIRRYIKGENRMNIGEKKEFVGYVNKYDGACQFETDKTVYSKNVVLAIDELLRTETKDCEKYKITIEKLEAEMI